jgi:hypothetical protein
MAGKTRKNSSQKIARKGSEAQLRAGAVKMRGHMDASKQAPQNGWAETRHYLTNKIL